MWGLERQGGSRTGAQRLVGRPWGRTEEGLGKEAGPEMTSALITYLWFSTDELQLDEALEACQSRAPPTNTLIS